MTYSQAAGRFSGGAILPDVYVFRLELVWRLLWFKLSFAPIVVVGECQGRPVGCWFDAAQEVGLSADGTLARGNPLWPGSRNPAAETRIYHALTGG